MAIDYKIKYERAIIELQAFDVMNSELLAQADLDRARYIRRLAELVTEKGEKDQLIDDLMDEKLVLVSVNEDLCDRINKDLNPRVKELALKVHMGKGLRDQHDNQRITIGELQEQVRVLVDKLADADARLVWNREKLKKCEHIGRSAL